MQYYKINFLFILICDLIPIYPLEFYESVKSNYIPVVLMHI